MTRKSLEPKVFQVKSDNKDDVLLGSQCRKCHQIFFPPREWCAACYEPTCESIELSREGDLASFTLSERKQPYSLPEPPYVLGEVLLPEGIRVYTTINVHSKASSDGIKVYSTINSENLSSLKIGQKVRLCPVVIKKDEEGHDIVAYNFNVMEEE